ncbi:MAG: hypothetical protein ACYTFK_04245 [Planctomycetota bacterium]|jgi:hypothetical protein
MKIDPSIRDNKADWFPLPALARTSVAGTINWISLCWNLSYIKNNFKYVKFYYKKERGYLSASPFRRGEKCIDKNYTLIGPILCGGTKPTTYKFLLLRD